MYGRSRGRLLLEEGLGAPPRRPGAPSSPPPVGRGPVALTQPPPALSPTTLRPLTDALFSGAVVEAAAFDAVHATFEAANSPSHIDQFITTIFNNILKDASNTEHIAKYVWIASKHKASGGEVVLRKFFSELEKRFSEWGGSEASRMKSEKPTEYRNFVKFFLSVTHHTRNRLAPPFDDLVNALFTLMEPLSASESDDDLALLALCIVRYTGYQRMKGAEAAGGFSGDLEGLTLNIRKKIHARRGRVSEVAAAWLLLALEASSAPKGFDSLSERVRQHYASVLGPSVNVLSSENEAISIPKTEASKYNLENVDASNLNLI